MINLPCGWSSQYRLIKPSGCGVWVGYGDSPEVWGRPHRPFLRPHFHKGAPYCDNCIKGFDVVHLGFGLLVRPKEESDDLPAPAGPGLTELYGEVKV